MSNGGISVPHPRHDLAVVDVRVRRAFHVKHAKQAALHAGERVIDERVVAGYVELELGDDRAPLAAPIPSGCLR